MGKCEHFGIFPKELEHTEDYCLGYFKTFCNYIEKLGYDEDFKKVSSFCADDLNLSSEVLKRFDKSREEIPVGLLTRRLSRLCIGVVIDIMGSTDFYIDLGLSIYYNIDGEFDKLYISNKTYSNMTIQKVMYDFCITDEIIKIIESKGIIAEHDIDDEELVLDSINQMIEQEEFDLKGIYNILHNKIIPEDFKNALIARIG